MRSDIPHEIECLLRWLELREAGANYRPLSNTLRIDVAHSALLRRLLDGKEPLPEPPPKAMSYPWYDLVEQGKGEPFEVFELNSKELVINQYRWRILEKIGPQEWTVTYGSGATTWRCWLVAEEGGPFGKKWALEQTDPRRQHND